MKTLMIIQWLLCVLFLSPIPAFAEGRDAHTVGTAAAHAEAKHGEVADEHSSDGHSSDGHSSDGHGGLDSTQLLAAVVNFAVLVLVLFWLLRKPLRDFLRARREKLSADLAESETIRANAQKRFAEYEARLKNMDQELEQIRENIVATGRTERDTIVAEAEKKVARIRRETDFLIEQQAKQLKIDLESSLARNAISGAQSRLKQATSAADHERLAAQFLERLKSGDFSIGAEGRGAVHG